MIVPYGVFNLYFNVFKTDVIIIIIIIIFMFIVLVVGDLLLCVNSNSCFFFFTQISAHQDGVISMVTATSQAEHALRGRALNQTVHQ